MGTISSVDDILSLWPDLWERVQPSRAAACAVDLALWDWLANSRSITFAEHLWNEPARRSPVASPWDSQNSTPNWPNSPDFPSLKSNSPAKIRSRSSPYLVVDTNAAWDAPFLAQIAPQLAALDVGFIEQPLPPAADFAPTPLPISADESCVNPEDIDRLPEVFSGFNIKLVARNLRTMTGCMLESSILISADFAIAQRTDYPDLDSDWVSP
ncbi:MAG: enolase C-terminal domain-like protein [Chthoniobacterales bacterium]